MNERSILLAQIGTLLQQLQSAQESLGAKQIDAGLRDSAKYRFANLISQLRNDLQLAKEDVDSVPDDFDLSAYWQKLTVQKGKCTELFKECLNFLGGAMLRNIDRIDQLCRIADALSFELSKLAGIEWNRSTILAEGNFFTESTGVIRLTFPDYSLWNLPVAVHELGHWAGPQINKPDGSVPFRDKLQQMTLAYPQAAEAEMERSFWREEFSDVFATYALGPAYVCSCLVAVFSPVDSFACKDGKRHPAHAKRAYLMLEMLKAMSVANHNQYDKIAAYLSDLWERNLKAAGRVRCLDQALLSQLDNRLSELYSILVLASSVEYKAWTRASELAEGLKGNQSVAQLVKPGDRIADVLNAIWLWRITQSNVDDIQLHSIDAKAIAMCRNIMGGKPRQERRSGTDRRSQVRRPEGS
ncbi:MAG: hypothetical protein JWM21_3570 [Acidobacteria bacterium]|nr:hypothetical protein [Acidobacteriota bacterium]